MKTSNDMKKYNFAANFIISFLADCIFQETVLQNNNIFYHEESDSFDDAPDGHCHNG